jgi:hypothetical protein
MRQVKYLSYSSFSLFESNPEEFYVKYLSEARGTREPQNHYMAVGSAFDAFVKADLHKRFVNNGDPQYTAEALFEAQVEPHNRDRARIDGQDVYAWYKRTGAYADLCIDMEGCVNPSFESSIEGDISLSGFDGTVSLMGKPDIKYVAKTGVRVIHDFKVQGYYSKAPKTPTAGYIKMFPGGMHKNCMPGRHRGMMINVASPMHFSSPDWAEQLSMYAWIMGAPIGSDYILSVDQLCCNSREKTIRVAKHSALCQEDWQKKLFERLHRCWSAIKTGHIFLSDSYEQSQARIETLELTLKNVPPPEFREINARVR